MIRVSNKKGVRKISPAFTRGSLAYKADGSWVESGKPRYEWGRFHNRSLVYSSSDTSSWVSSGGTTQPLQYDNTEQAYYTPTHRKMVVPVEIGKTYIVSVTGKGRSEGTQTYFTLVNAGGGNVGMGFSAADTMYVRKSITLTATSNVLTFTVYDKMWIKGDLQIEEALPGQTAPTPWRPGQTGKAVMVEEGTTNTHWDPGCNSAAAWVGSKSVYSFQPSGGLITPGSVRLGEGSTSTSYCYGSITVSAGTYTLSANVRMSDGSVPVLGTGGGNVRLNMTGGTAAGESLTPIGNGWYRISRSITDPTGGSIGPVHYTPNGTVYSIWSDFQLEAKAYPTSYADRTVNLIPAGARTFDKAQGWVEYQGASVTVTQGQSVPEWGCNDATRIQISGGSAYSKYLYSGMSARTPGNPETVSCYVKNIGTNTVRIANFSAGTVNVNPGETKRAEAPVVAAGGTSRTFEFQTLDPAHSLDIIAWHPQVEARPTASAYGADGVRQGEGLKVPASVMNLSQGTVHVWAKPLVSTGSPQMIFDARNTDWSGPFIEYTSAKKISVNGIVSATTVNPGDSVMVSLCWNGNDYRAFVNGSLIGAATDPFRRYTSGRQVNLGRGWEGSMYLNGLIDSIKISNRAETDAEILASYTSLRPFDYDANTTALFHWDDALTSYTPAKPKRYAPTFTRASMANLSNGTAVVVNAPRYELGRFVKANLCPDASGWEQGTINGADGTNLASTTRIRTKTDIAVSPSTQYQYSGTPGWSGFVAEYRADGSFIQNGLHYAFPFVFTTSPNTAKVRLLSKIDDGTTITPATPSPWQFQFGLPGKAILIEEPTTNLAPAQGEWEQGTINPTNGIDAISATRIRSKVSFTASPSTQYTVSGPAGWSANVYEYASDGAFVKQSGFGVVPITVTTQANTASLRLVAKLDDSTTVTPSTPSPWCFQVEQRGYKTSYQVAGIPRAGESLFLPAVPISVSAGFTIEGWFEITKKTGQDQFLFDTRTSGGAYCHTYVDGPNGMVFVWLSDGSVLSQGESLTVGKHHYAVKADSSGTKLFIDGALKGTTTKQVALDMASPKITMGSRYSISQHLNGTLDTHRVSGVARGDDEIIAGYTKNAPFVWDEKTIWLTHFDDSMAQVVGPASGGSSLVRI